MISNEFQQLRPADFRNCRGVADRIARIRVLAEYFLCRLQGQNPGRVFGLPLENRQHLRFCPSDVLFVKTRLRHCHIQHFEGRIHIFTGCQQMSRKIVHIRTETHADGFLFQNFLKLLAVKIAGAFGQQCRRHCADAALLRFVGRKPRVFEQKINAYNRIGLVLKQISLYFGPGRNNFPDFSFKRFAAQNGISHQLLRVKSPSQRTGIFFISRKTCSAQKHGQQNKPGQRMPSRSVLIITAFGHQSSSFKGSSQPLTAGACKMASAAFFTSR